MQVMPIILFAVVMAVDGGLRPLAADWPLAAALGGLFLWGVPALAVTFVWLIFKFTMRSAPSRKHAALAAADQSLRIARWFILANHVFSVLVLDGLGAVRSLVGDLVLLDELLAVLPALLALMALWWIYYPLDRMLHEALLVRRLDLGLPAYAFMRRGRYVLVQTRVHLLLLLTPILLIAGLAEALEVGWRYWRPDSNGPSEGLTILIAAIVFLFSPFIARLVLDVQPLPPGEIRDSLTDVCGRHRVGVRDLLLWDTNGSMINAAVMGLVRPLRYVLITDALLESLRATQVQAVMAHEIGHVRRRHIVWMIVCLFACALLAAHAIEWPLRTMEALGRWPAEWINAYMVISAILQLAIALTLFGWVCRRFERQADAFAAQHLSGLGTPAAAHACITPEAVDAMRSSLEAIADLNTIDPARHSWRHGSIRWRQRHLESIIGQPIAHLRIDRVVRRLKLASVLVLALGFGYEIMARQIEQSHLAQQSATHATGARAAHVGTPSDSNVRSHTRS